MFDVEFFYRGNPVGKFLDEWIADALAALRYEPYRGQGHDEMQAEIRANGSARCYCDSNKGRHSFAVRPGGEGQSLALSEYALAQLPGNDAVAWLEPWVPAGPGAELELAKEAGEGHPLFGRRCVPVARRIDRDDILFAVEGSGGQHAVVQLTWSGKRESDPASPKTELFASREDWLARMRKDHAEYTAY